MTIEELDQFRNLKKEIDDDEQRVKELRLKAEGLSSPDFGSTHNSSTESITEMFVTKVNALADATLAKLPEYITLYEQIDRYIQSIPDSQTRRIFKMRFFKGLTWRKIADVIEGNNTEDSVKKVCYRYIWRHNEKLSHMSRNNQI